MSDQKLDVAFDITQGNYRLVALWGDQKEAECEMFKNGVSIRKFTYPAYKVFNLQAHFSDIIAGYEEDNPDAGFQTAGDTFLGSSVMPTDIS